MMNAHQLVTTLLEAEPDELNPKDYLDQVDFGKYVRSYRIVDHGLTHSDYFQGHGVGFTQWQDCATGAGDDAYEALDDAIEQLVYSGWDFSKVEAEIEAEKNSWDRLKVNQYSVRTWLDDAQKEIKNRLKGDEPDRELTPEEEDEASNELAHTNSPYYYVSLDVSQKGPGYDEANAAPLHE